MVEISKVFDQTKPRLGKASIKKNLLVAECPQTGGGGTNKTLPPFVYFVDIHIMNAELTETISLSKCLGKPQKKFFS